ncbi:MAG: 30S ribosomal protein S16 [Clostridia bacterium]|nr:30S ribosomal protein S16 [Clostridia bacterium]
MAVKLRLTRMGGKKSPFYRIIAVDSRKARDGQYIEQIGIYNPVKEPAEIRINAEIAKKWLDNGAQPTDTVRDLFYNAGIIESTKAFQAKTTAADEADKE